MQGLTNVNIQTNLPHSNQYKTLRVELPAVLHVFWLCVIHACLMRGDCSASVGWQQWAECIWKSGWFSQLWLCATRPVLHYWQHHMCGSDSFKFWIFLYKCWIIKNYLKCPGRAESGILTCICIYRHHFKINNIYYFK